MFFAVTLFGGFLRVKLVVLGCDSFGNVGRAKKNAAKATCHRLSAKPAEATADFEQFWWRILVKFLLVSQEKQPTPKLTTNLQDLEGPGIILYISIYVQITQQKGTSNLLGLLGLGPKFQTLQRLQQVKSRAMVSPNILWSPLKPGNPQGYYPPKTNPFFLGNGNSLHVDPDACC